MIHPKSSAWNNPIECDFQRPIIIDDRVSPWQKVVVDRLNHLCALRPGWDGYCARPVAFGTANFALRILQSLCSPRTPVPSIVPGTNGDLQIEWHTASWDVEIHVLAPNNVEAWRAPADCSDEGEEEKTDVDFTVIAGWVKSLAEPEFAAFATAA